MEDRARFDQIVKRQVALKALAAGSFFYGEQALYVRKFIKDIQEREEKAGETIRSRIFFLFDTGWPEILDEASSLDIFCFSPKKIFLVCFPEYEENDQQAADRAFQQYVSPYQQEIERYFSSPVPSVLIVIVYSGKLKKGHKLLELFSSLKAKYPGNFDLQEIKTPKDSELVSWISDELRRRGKKISSAVARKLLEVTGAEMVSVVNELEKLSLYGGERKEIIEEDVSAVCAWQKSYDRFAIEEALESGNLAEALDITRSFFADQPDPSEVIGFFGSISRYVISLDQAKVEVEKLKIPVEEVFKKLRPQIQEGWSLFDRKLSAFTDCLKSLSQKDLDHLVHELGKIDLKLKTSELDAAILLETFLFKFFWFKEGKKEV
jgi:DNA polymerase-3 subunit delta